MLIWQLMLIFNSSNHCYKKKALLHGPVNQRDFLIQVGIGLRLKVSTVRNKRWLPRPFRSILFSFYSVFCSILFSFYSVFVLFCLLFSWWMMDESHPLLLPLLQKLLECTKSEEEKTNLKSGVDKIMNEMGQRFKFLSLFPLSNKEFFQNNPPAGFS